MVHKYNPLSIAFPLRPANFVSEFTTPRRQSSSSLSLSLQVKLVSSCALLAVVLFSIYFFSSMNLCISLAYSYL